MTTKEIINKALEVMNGQDWYWYLSDYQVSEMKDKAYSTMRYFVELVMSSPTDIQTKEYNDRKAELMAVILPSYNMAA